LLRLGVFVHLGCQAQIDPMKRQLLQPGASTPWLELVRRHVPTAQIEIVSGVGHFAMLEAPQAVNQILAAFVATMSQTA
jgi:pimeloyl-ACP methyl ester carboxylesterase